LLLKNDSLINNLKFGTPFAESGARILIAPHLLENYFVVSFSRKRSNDGTFVASALRFILTLLLGYGEKLYELSDLHFWHTELK
jgi:hypothetical protein